MTCINCDSEHDNKHCPNCGERAEVPQITFRSLFNNGVSTITNMDKGFLYNLKSLFIEPRKLVTDYIKGKRKGILNPISYMIICISFFLIIESFVDFGLKDSREEYKNVEGIKAAAYYTGVFFATYFKYFWILSVFCLGLATKFVFGKYNYAEHLAISSFVIGQTTLISIIGTVLFKIKIILVNPFIHIVIFWLLYKIFDDRTDSFGLFFQALTAMVLFFLFLIFEIGVLVAIQYYFFV